MKRIAAIHVYDTLEMVTISYVIREYSDYTDEGMGPVQRGIQQIRGTGESDPSRWLQEAVVALAEYL